MSSLVYQAKNDDLLAVIDPPRAGLRTFYNQICNFFPLSLHHFSFHLQSHVQKKQSGMRKD